MSLPIVFIHRTAEEHVGFCMQQAKYSNPSSRVILIGNPENRNLSKENSEHFLLSHFYQSAQAFSYVYKHSTSNTYEYNLFCFQRWFILRDFMRSQGIERCCYLDSDVMLYTDINKRDNEDFDDFTFEYTWTTVCDLEKLNQFCDYATKFFRDPLHYQTLLQFAKNELGDVPISDMVLFILFHNYVLRRNATYGIVANGFFDHNLNCPFAPSCPQADSYDGKKQIYQKDGALYCKITGTTDYLSAHSLHFQGLAKGYIPYFRSQDIPNTDDFMYFDYPTCKWVRAEP